jgi:hypothetical protein
MHESGTFVRFGPANPKHPAIPAGDKRQGNLLHWKPLGLSPIDGMGIGKTGRSIDPPDGHPRPTHSRLMWRKSHKDDAGRSVIAVATVEVGGGGDRCSGRGGDGSGRKHGARFGGCSDGSRKRRGSDNYGGPGYYGYPAVLYGW